MVRSRWEKRGLSLFLISIFLLFTFPMDAFARVGGGRSTGSRGSRSSSPPRSYSSPSSSTPSQQPQQSTSQSPSASQRTPSSKPSPSPPPPPPPQSAFWRGLAGGVLGGLIGGMLFRGLGFGGNLDGFGGGIGLIEILLIGLLLYGLFRFLRKRRQVAATDGNYQSSYEAMGSPQGTSYGPGYGTEAQGDLELGKGLGHIRQMDSSFDEKRFQDLCMDTFFKIQGAWANRDLSGVKKLLTEEMAALIQEEADKLRAKRQINRLENIAVRSVEIVEAWQESGRDYVTVRFYANLLDYTVDEMTGQVISGSRTEPVKFEEYWTLTRPVGNHPWQLSAIQQVE